VLAWARWWVTDPDPSFVQFAVAMLALEGYYDGLTLAQLSDVLYQLRRQYYSPPQAPTFTIAWPANASLTEQQVVAVWKQWVDDSLLPGLTTAQVATFLRAVAARLTAVGAYK